VHQNVLIVYCFFVSFFLYHSLMNKVAQNLSTEMMSDGLFETAARLVAYS